MDNNRKKQTKRYVALGMATLLVLLLALLPMIASSAASSDEPEASILSAVPEYRDIETQLLGGGQLSSEAAIKLEIPENVKLTKYLVGNGDVLSAGDAVASVDKVSVMSAIVDVQDTLDYLSEQITDASDDVESGTVSALVAGTVKQVYAQVGDSVQDVMLEYGALAVLSLDGMMAVDIETDGQLQAGDAVTVTLADGSTAEGRVKANVKGLATVTVDDDDYSAGQEVSVSDSQGRNLGSGQLYIHSQWNATAYSGTVSRVSVKPGNQVYLGSTLMQLESQGHTAKYQRLIDQRTDYEELMSELFDMYSSGVIVSPCDGIVSGVDNEVVYLLSGQKDGLLAKLIGFVSGNHDGFEAYAAQVVSVSPGGMELNYSKKCYEIKDLSTLSTINVDLSKLSERLSYSGDTTIYYQSSDGILHPMGQARPGDLLLAVGHGDELCWFVLLSGGAHSETAPVADSVLMLLSADSGENNDSGSDASLPSDEGPSQYSEDPPAGGGQIKFGAISPNDDSSDGGGDENGGNENGGDENGGDNTGCGGAGTVTIVTTALSQGMVGQEYSSSLQASDGTNVLSGSWTAVGLPAGLSIDPSSGLISGIPTVDGSFSVTIGFDGGQSLAATRDYTLTVMAAAATPARYTGYVAQVTEVSEGTAKLMQTPYSYTVTDLSALAATVKVNRADLTVEKTYTSPIISPVSLAVGDLLLIALDDSGVMTAYEKLPTDTGSSSGDSSHGGGMSGMGGLGGSGMASGAGMGTGAAVQAYELYSLEKLTIASVTSQEHMTVDISVDESDIGSVYVGQPAIVSVEALAGERFNASVTSISNSGENDGGSSKFIVELTLARSGNMLPGMYASASLNIGTAVNALCLPVAALSEDGTRSIIYTAYDENKAELSAPVQVVTGVSDGEFVQILDGAVEGQHYYYAYYDTLVLSNTPESHYSFARGGR